MQKKGVLSLLFALVLAISILPVSAAAATSQTAPVGEGWLIPKLRDYAAFTDTAGTIAEQAAAACCQAGLMDGVDGKHFLPSAGLTQAQIIVVSARLHRLLSGGSLTYFEPISLTGTLWWTPYDGYLTEQIPALADTEWYPAMKEAVTASCTRESFFRLLAAVLDDTGTTLPEINGVDAVPDCCDQTLMQFYRLGVLGGKDAYGTLEGSAWLTRGAAAAMLARLIDPTQRLTLDLEPLELCQQLLGVDPDTVLMTLDGQDVTAGEFMPTLVSTVSGYNHEHFGSMILEQSGRTSVDAAVEELQMLVLCETLAEELGLDVPPSDTLYFAGYQGLTAQGQAWQAHHSRLRAAVVNQLGEESFPMDRLPTVTYAAVWDTLPFSDFSWRLYDIPVWGGHF